MFAFVVIEFFSTKPRDWLERTSLKWPIMHRVGRKTLTQSSSLADQNCMSAHADTRLRNEWTLNCHVASSCFVVRCVVMTSQSLSSEHVTQVWPRDTGVTQVWHRCVAVSVLWRSTLSLNSTGSVVLSQAVLCRLTWGSHAGNSELYSSDATHAGTGRHLHGLSTTYLLTMNDLLTWRWWWWWCSVGSCFVVVPSVLVECCCLSDVSRVVSSDITVNMALTIWCVLSNTVESQYIQVTATAVYSSI